MRLLKIVLGTCLLLKIALISFGTEKETAFRVSAFGGKSDGITLNSAAIQKAIDAASAHGGRTVTFEKGIYLSGSIELKSNVQLYLEKGAILLGSTNPLDYHELKRWKALILADGQTNIGISDIVATNTGNPLFIKLGHRNVNGQVGKLRNVHIRNIKVEVPSERPDKNYIQRGPDLPFFHNPFPVVISGIPGYAVENVVIENMEIICPGGAYKGYAY